MPEILIGIAIDVVVRRQDSFMASLGIADPKWQLAALGALTLAVWIFESVFEYLYLVSWRNLSQDFQHELRLDAYTHVQRPRSRVFRGPQHRRARDDLERRRESAGALPRRRRERSDPGRDHRVAVGAVFFVSRRRSR